MTPLVGVWPVPLLMPDCGWTDTSVAMRYSPAVIIISLWLAVGWPAEARAQEATSPPQASANPPTAASDLSLANLRPLRSYRRIKLFDFDETHLGNYGASPMHWKRVEGPGLPAFAQGVFDKTVGHDDPPSFKLHTPIESVAFEYAHSDLDAIAGADHLILGYVRCENVREGRAFIEAYYVDRFGEQLPGTQQISALHHSIAEPGQEEPWQEFALMLPGNVPEAHGLRLRLMLLQGYIWRDAPRGTVDPIIEQDVNPTAWFDDLAIYRLPSASLHFSNPANVVQPDAQEQLEVRVHNATDQVLRAEVTVIGPDGRQRHTDSTPVSAQATLPWRTVLPALEPDVYRAQLTLSNNVETLIQRQLDFVVLNELPEQRSIRGNVGVDLRAERIYAPEAVAELVDALGAGVVTVGVPMVGELETTDEIDYFNELSHLGRELNARRIAVIGNLLADDVNPGISTGTSTRQFVADEERFKRAAASAFAPHLGGLIVTWQLGHPRLEALQPAWTAELLGDIRGQMDRYVALPELVIPRSVMDTTSQPEEGNLWFVPASLPTRDLPRQLDMFGDKSTVTRWLMLDWERQPLVQGSAAATELARRIVIGVALDPDRLMIPAPLRVGIESGQPTWTPTEHFIPVRTLYHYLSGKRGVGAIPLPNDSIALIFDGAQDSCVVLWTWRAEPLSEPVEVYFGGEPKIVDLWGNRRTLPVSDGKTKLDLTPTPQILIDVDAPLALLQASFDIDPSYVQAHITDPPPILSFRNHYTESLIGSIELEAPRGWSLQPQRQTFTVAAGETYELPLEFNVPARHPAGRQQLKAQLILERPIEAELDFMVPLTLGLRDVQVDISLAWEAGTLRIDQELRNLSEQTVNFLGLCQVPGRAPREASFLDIPAGESVSRSYLFRDASINELRGMDAYLRLSERGGDRELNQVVEIPR